MGDVFQLEPVVKSDEREILNRFYPNPYFFSAKVFQGDGAGIHRTHQGIPANRPGIRQRAPTISGLITAGNADLQLLNTRYTPTPPCPEENDLYITLATRRDNVDYINEKKLNELPGEPVTLKGEIHGEFPESSSLP